ncbi:PAS domain-containing protein [Halohasta salina]|uniref:PAS domain-containing protein n=1 Tax=Halohasta salina TaxID=2961621 RepID=UPI0020A5585A|nr:PAS domain-containing protein [Halohasta salina]
MSADAELRRLFETHAASDGPLIDSMDVVETVADTLGRIRTAAGPEAHHGEDAPLSWNTPAMDDAPVGVTISGPAYRDNPIYYANAAFEEITGYDEADVLGENLRLLQGSGTASAPVADLHEAIDIWAPVVVDLRNYRQDGTPFRNHLAIAPIPDETGTISNWVGLQEDVTDSRGL